MFKKLLHGKRKSALLNLTWSGLLCRVVWSVSQLLYLLQRAGHFKFFSPSFFVGLELIQYVGRILRNHENKNSVRVYDYVDTQVPILRKMYAKREKTYRLLSFVPENTRSKESSKTAFDAVEAPSELF